MPTMTIKNNLELSILVEKTEYSVINDILSPFLVNNMLFYDVYLAINNCKDAIQYELDYMQKHPNLILTYWYHSYHLYNITTQISVGVKERSKSLWDLNMIPIIESLAKLISTKTSTRVAIEFIDWKFGSEESVPYKIYGSGIKIVDCYDKYNYLFNETDWIPRSALANVSHT